MDDSTSPRREHDVADVEQRGDDFPSAFMSSSLYPSVSIERSHDFELVLVGHRSSIEMTTTTVSMKWSVRVAASSRR